MSNNLEEFDFEVIDYLKEESMTPHHFDYKDTSKQTIYVPFSLYIKSLKNSFQNISPQNQLKKDFARSDIYINYHKATSCQSFIDYITNRYNVRMIRLLIGSTTQAVMGIPFEMIHKSLISDPDIYVTDVDQETERKYNLPPRMSVHLILNKQNRNKARIIVLKYLRIFHLDPVESNVTPLCLLRMKFKLNIEPTDRQSSAEISMKRYSLPTTTDNNNV